MFGVDPRTPCIIGAAQRTWRGETDAPEPLEMWAEVARTAAEDSGAPRSLSQLDSVQVVHSLTWPYDDPPSRLAERIGARGDAHRHYSAMGGTSPQILVGGACGAILDGAFDLVLIAGGEALATKKRIKRRGERAPWSFRNPDRGAGYRVEMPIHPSELAHGVLHAYLTFAFFDVARRAHLGIAPDQYRARLGELLAPMTQIAAGNPHAWFPVERSADEITTPTDDNRMVGYPYTKYMVAVMDVDMAGALILASEAKADELGVPRERRVYPRGWAYGTEVWNLAEREDMWASPVMARTSLAALDVARVGIDDLSYLDLYSCFSSAVLLARDALGIAPDDDRAITVTGGLPYAGGPGSNYMLHSIATMVGRLRGEPGASGMVTGIGMHMTKHAFGVYSSAPGPFEQVDGVSLQSELDALPRRPIEERYSGAAEIASYTIEYGRDGSRVGLAICDIPDGARCYARFTDPDMVAEAEARELVGASVTLTSGDDGVNSAQR